MDTLVGNVRHLSARALQEGSDQLSVYGVGIAFIVITTVVMGMRLWVRLVLLRGGLGADDSDALPLDNFVPLLQSNYANRLLYVIALMFVKLSILVFYLRIDPRRLTRYAIYFLLFTVIGLQISTVIICIFGCIPPQKYWDVTGAQPGQCMSNLARQTFFEANGIINIIQDILIYLLPIPMMWHLQIPRRQKIAVTALFMVGFVSVAAGCVRYYYVLKLANEADIWFYFAASLNWCSIEVCAALICGSASTFKTLMRAYLPKLWGSKLSNGASSHQYDQSHSGDFAMKTFGQQQSRSTRNGKRGLHDLTVNDGSSEEAIVPPKLNDHKKIVMKREITMEVSEPIGDETKDMRKHKIGDW
ncbi:hypothetical protein GQ53DRAFT_886317 [Thozetella sp. PMI_491]|nr:hypothetical protein GQ53DRAFT_886317 [Thozetella sp. PMI_491]